VSIRCGVAPVNLLVTTLGVELGCLGDASRSHSPFSLAAWLRSAGLALRLCVGAVPVTVTMEIHQR
jgi:hypothetical protein